MNASDALRLMALAHSNITGKRWGAALKQLNELAREAELPAGGMLQAPHLYDWTGVGWAHDVIVDRIELVLCKVD